MKPYILTIQAFGPFEEETIVDFTRFGNSLFLITGKTGSGKSTIFDALMYALFGETSGKERAPKDMRTQNIDAKIKTIITLKFGHNGHTYRIERTISGRKSSAEDATFWNDDGSIVEKTRAVNAAIETLLGIEAEQFRMIAMLPQGKFRELLTAKSENKSEILKKLFDTRIYALFQNKLKERDSLYRDEHGAFERDITTHIQHLKVPEDNPTYAWLSDFVRNPSVEDSTLEALFSDLQKLADDDIQESKKITAELQSLEQELIRISEEKGTAESNNRLLKNVSDAHAELEKLLPKEEDHIHLKTTLERAYAAKSVSATETAYRNAVRFCTGIKTTINADTKFIEENSPALKNLEEEIRKLEADPGINIAQERCNTLKAARQKYLDLAETANELTRLEKEIVASVERTASIDTCITEITDQIQVLEMRDTELGTVDVESTEIRNLLDKIGEKQNILDDLDTLFDELGSLDVNLQLKQNACREAKDAYLTHQAKAENLYQLYLDGQAGILADTLKDGMPCPVCGSCSHPVRATHSDTIPDRTSVNAAQTDAEMKRTAWTKKSTEAAACKEKRNAKEEEIRKIAGVFVPVTGSIGEIRDSLKNSALTLQKEETGLVLKSRELKKREEEKKKIAESLPKLRTERELKIKEKANAERIYSTCTGQKNELDRTMAGISRGLPYPTQREAEDELEIISKKLEQHENKLVACRRQRDDLQKKLSQASGALQTAERQLETAQREETETHAAYQHALNTNGFTSEEAYHASLMDAEHTTNLEHTVDDFFKNLNTAKALVLHTEETAKGRSYINIETLVARHSELSGKRDRLRATNTIYETRLSENKQTGDIIAEKWNREKSRAELYTAVHKLAETANGTVTGQERLDLERYIQAVYFSEILHFANSQLLTMSGNRYTLIRPETATTLRGKSGLELAVTDRFTGQTRDIATLSGGESFLAALALALGLSEMIQHLSGGISIDALFVDEGFDTLDTDALQDVLKVLWTLTTGNRVVGIISHRSELRDQLDRKIIVTKLGSGRSRLDPKY